MSQRPGPDHAASHEGTTGQHAETNDATEAAGVVEIARVLDGVGREIASARSHLRLVQDSFDESDTALHRARGLLNDTQNGSAHGEVAPITKRLVPVVRVSLLGAFRTVIDSVEVVDWKGSKSRALFIYLVSHRHGRIPREQLLESLWPGTDVEAAANSLRVAVHGLRLAIAATTGSEGSDRGRLIVFEKGGYTLNPLGDFQIDNEEFERHWSRGRRLTVAGDSAGSMQAYEQAEAVYRGDFLQDEPYEEWSMLRREGLKDIYLSVLSRLSARAYAMGDYEGCIQRCQKLIAADTCREDTYQLLIRSHERLGQPGRARRWYEVCVKVLRDELDVGPSQQTKDAYKEIFDKAG